LLSNLIGSAEFWAFLTLIATQFFSLIKSDRSSKKKEKALLQNQKRYLKKDLMEIKERGEVTATEYIELDEQLEVYKSMGGNGEVEELWNEVKELWRQGYTQETPTTD